MKSVLFFIIIMQFVTSLTTDNVLTMTFDRTTETNLQYNVSLTTSSALSTSRLPLSGFQSTYSYRPYKSRDSSRTDAPMLNYIFDTHSSKGKHHHHDTYKWGPHFDPAEAKLNGSTVTVQVGDTAILNCKVNFLQDKTRKFSCQTWLTVTFPSYNDDRMLQSNKTLYVKKSENLEEYSWGKKKISWVRRKENDELQLLTVGRHTYSGDDRYTLEFQYPGNWRLQIKFVSKKDEGLYECQISTHPPKVTQTFLYINAPEVVIVDEHGMQLMDKYYESDSTIQLSCIVRHVAMTSSVVLWLHGNRILNYDLTRGGISVKTELMEAGANSTLSVAKVNKTDSGNYTCSISKTEYATVMVHVLNEESLAELHHGGKSPLYGADLTLLLLILSFLLIVVMR